VTGVAALTLTRDRLDYTKHCFACLRENAGHPYDHYILDQGSTDGTQEWLRNEYDADWIDLRPDNIGISKGLNDLLDAAGPHYDYYLKFDNDCEVTHPDTLKTTLAVAEGGDWMLSPRVLGLRSPPPHDDPILVNGHKVGALPQIGGIFLLIPGRVIRAGFRYDETNPSWGMDDVQICHWFREQGGHVGYLLDVTVNHYETTDGQWERYPDYFAQKIREGLPA